MNEYTIVLSSNENKYKNTLYFPGKLSTRQQQLLSRQPQFRPNGGRSGEGRGGASGGGATRALRKILPSRRAPALALLASTLRADPSKRPPAKDLLRHVYFTHDNFAEQFPIELRRRAHQESQVCLKNNNLNLIIIPCYIFSLILY